MKRCSTGQGWEVGIWGRGEASSPLPSRFEPLGSGALFQFLKDALLSPSSESFAVPSTRNRFPPNSSFRCQLQCHCLPWEALPDYPGKVKPHSRKHVLHYSSCPSLSNDRPPHHSTVTVIITAHHSHCCILCTWLSCLAPSTCSIKFCDQVNLGEVTQVLFGSKLESGEDLVSIIMLILRQCYPQAPQTLGKSFPLTGS